MCGPKWPERGLKHGSARRGIFQFDCAATLFAVERVTGIEPALSAWESSRCPASRARPSGILQGNGNRGWLRLTVVYRCRGHAEGTEEAAFAVLTGAWASSSRTSPTATILVAEHIESAPTAAKWRVAVVVLGHLAAVPVPTRLGTDTRWNSAMSPHLAVGSSRGERAEKPWRLDEHPDAKPKLNGGNPMAGEYRLDELGWYQFERLCQALPKARYGASVEAWGGGKDFGRDAYSSGPLLFPNPNVETQGPFVFQVKFVDAANASGARPLPSLKAAVRVELDRIEKRVDEEEWEVPSVYVLMTNVPVGARGRHDLKALIQGSLDSVHVVIVCARDLWAELDASPAVRMAYPQILGLRDLETLIRLGAAAGVVARSNVALDRVARLSASFVATEAYNRTLQLLEVHAFVVLTGPPEMGKTATARMVSLARSTCGWDAYDCRSPEDVFRLYDRNRSQVFLADDAFGSTEYRPNIAAEWAAQLESVLAICSKRHWVIWTSRPGPLRTGLERLHMQGVSDSFPDPTQVLVDASRLSVAEKAQILYRHAKATGLSDRGRALGGWCRTGDLRAGVIASGGCDRSWWL
jgi:hypothetical protein